MDKEEEKEEEDFAGFSELIGKLSKEMKDNPIKIESEFKYPMEISGIKVIPPSNINTAKTGLLVKIRPIADAYGQKTYLGIYLGDIPVEAIVGLYTKTNILSILSHANPAIFVPELKKVIFGYESWWGEIESVKDLEEISDGDIEDIWYVKLLKASLAKEEEDRSNE